MFTGIIEHKAKVLESKRKPSGLVLSIQKPAGWKLKLGDSVATDGACLTVKALAKNSYEAELMKETLSKTSFGKKAPMTVNLERPLKWGSRLDGHIVLGHVDTVGVIKKITKQGSSKVFSISFPAKTKKLVVSKGSVAVDGISLTVASAKKNLFSVALVPYSLKHTTLGDKKVGDLVNIEFDILGKYVLGR